MTTKKLLAAKRYCWASDVKKLF